ncbi:MAG: DUF3145 domain-containing protein [Candidatus Nanopelagicales bacterium]
MATPIHMTRAQRAQTRGVVYIHDAGKAFCKPIEWALSEVLGIDTAVQWTPQPIAPTRMRAELSWVAPAGTAARVVHALRQLPDLRFEVTEEPTVSSEGERYSHTPGLGVFRAHMSAHGDVLVNEQRLRTVLESAEDVESMRSALGLLLGTPWDNELESFRTAGEGTAVRWLHRVG